MAQAGNDMIGGGLLLAVALGASQRATIILHITAAQVEPKDATTLAIEIAGNANQKSEPKKLAGEGCREGLALSRERRGPPHLLEHSHKELEEESIPTLKEQLRLAELACSRLQVQYEKYRLRWLEENHRARILKEYAPAGISTWSPRQIDWNAPSPIQSDDNDGFEDIAGEEIP
ncbi:hypothetical protein EDD22DRAFT_849021 [Suillus occidentalis]|nr:hypothetical protein EDD22DRAFT_853608 [Suillus occidentalis]KAG1759766.1 hypothetical protein EDD22DRAFT_849021 [Suillus occidentalis]